MTSADLSVLQPYCENDMQLLKKISRSIFMRFNEPLARMDYDDFFSIANMTLWQAYNAYDANMGISFDGFLRSCLQKKFKSELTHRHRQKRVLNQLAVSLDAAGDGEDECSLLEFVPSDFGTFEEAVKRNGSQAVSEKVQQYISRLSDRQVNILNLLIDGYRANEIQEILGMSAREYTENLQIMRSYENVKILF